MKLKNWQINIKFKGGKMMNNDNLEYCIKIYYMGNLCGIKKTNDFKKAKSLYYKNSDILYQYTQLCVGEKEYTTAEAEEYFGIRENKDKFIIM